MRWCHNLVIPFDLSSHTALSAVSAEYFNCLLFQQEPKRFAIDSRRCWRVVAGGREQFAEAEAYIICIHTAGNLFAEGQEPKRFCSSRSESGQPQLPELDTLVLGLDACAEAAGRAACDTRDAATAVKGVAGASYQLVALVIALMRFGRRLRTAPESTALLWKTPVPSRHRLDGCPGLPAVRVLDRQRFSWLLCQSVETADVYFHPFGNCLLRLAQ